MDSIEPKASQSQICRFYSGKKIFITGATGFLGKVLLEKLLRLCTDVERIYILIRPKRGQTIETRLKILFKEKIFSDALKKNPSVFDKVTMIYGDLSKPNLGLSEEDRNHLISNVNIVFHGAATVNFEEKMRKSVNINVRGTKEVVCLCREITRLEALVYISTAYSNCNRQEIGEELYETRISPDSLLNVVDSLPDSILDSIAPQLKGTWPNNYVFTKQTAEGSVKSFGEGLPIAVFRPSIILASSKEPVPGWIDNLYGPAGTCFAISKGIMRVSMIHPSKLADVIPVDYCVNAILTVPWDISAKRSCPEVTVYNFVSSCENPITWGEYEELSFQAERKSPSNEALWFSILIMTQNIYLFHFLSFILHTVPATLMDLILSAFNKKIRMKELYSKVHRSILALSIFSTNEWKFCNSNVQNMWKKLNEADKYYFNFDVANLNWEEAIEAQHAGVRKYLMKEDESTIPEARKRMFGLFLLHNCLCLSVLLVFFWPLFRII